MTTIQPPAPPVSTPAPQTAAPLDGEVVSAEVVKLPDTLATTDRAVTLKGEVIAQNTDGTIRIATPRGAIDVKLPEGQQPPARGQTVEVQIPAGAPPRTVAVTLPQTNAPQIPTQLPLPDMPEIPAPQVIIGDLPEVPAQHQPQTPLANTPNISPKGLMEFLKTTLQNALKAPDTQGPQTQQTVQTALTQRPLALGQLARLIPLLPNQPVLPSTQQPLAAATPLPQNTPAIVSTSQQASTLTLPAHPQTATLQQTPLQSVVQTQLGKTVTLLPTAQTPQTPALQQEGVARILLPLAPLATQTPSLAGQPQTVTLPTPPIAEALKAATLPAPQTATPQTTLNISTTPKALPLLAVADIRIAAQLPTLPAATLQNPQTATLLHGTPATPVMFATVSGQTQQGLPVLDLPTFTTMPDGTLKPSVQQMVLQFPAKGITPQTILRLDVLPQGQAITAAAPSTQTQMPQAWDSIEETLRVLGADPETKVAHTQMQAVLPKAGPSAFTAPVLILASALRSADITQWVGEKTVDALKGAKRGNPLMKLAADFAAQREAADTPKGEWRTHTLPFLYGQEVHRIMLHSKGFERDDEANPSRKKSGTRFVLDISLTRMGPMQIDGFSLDKKLDITLRSERNFSPAARESMRTRYATALEGIGFAGQLNFSADPNKKGWVSF
ncbi:MAG: hypothetical protein KGQ41_07000 [Alphaproteobacteria bacterium]|nr:hypothetical protein [Alphaproteobacteria bacterium]